MPRISKEELINVAIRHFKAGRYKETIETCEKALALDRRYIRAYKGKAKSYICLDRPLDALAMYSQALSIEETSELYTLRGDLSLSLKKYIDASNDFSRALALDPNNENLKKKKAEATSFVDSRTRSRQRPKTDEPRDRYIYHDSEEWKFMREELEELEEEYNEYFNDWQIYINQYN